MTNSTKAKEQVNTRDKLAKIAGVGQDTYYKHSRIFSRTITYFKATTSRL